MTVRISQALCCLILALSAIGALSASPARATSADSGNGATVESAAAASERLEQYRAWIAEARETYPYRDSVEKMWAVMVCESHGDPDVVNPNGLYHGLFQYHKKTWRGSWNPYREESIYDAKAQIFATAKAWSEGYQRWWGCYKRR